MYLRGGKAVVAYNPDDVSAVWLLEDGNYAKFELIESRFRNSSAEEVDMMKAQQKNIVQAAKAGSVQAQVDLINVIDVIAASAVRCSDREWLHCNAGM